MILTMDLHILTLNFNRIIKIASRLVFIFGAIFCLSLLADAQKRNNLTDEEDMQIRDAQEIDLRMKVFIKVIERRLLAINDPNAAQSKQAQKDAGDWGDLRTGERAELLFDIQRTIDEAIAKIDDASERDEKNPLFSKAVRILAEGCGRIVPQLEALKIDAEKEGIFRRNSVDSCNQVIAATAKLPKEEIKTEKKKKN